MTECNIWQKHLDGRSSSPKDPEFIAHLSSCEDCVTQLRLWEECLRGKGEWEELTSPAEISETEVRALRLRVEEKRSLVRPWIWAPVAVGAVAAIIILFVRTPDQEDIRPTQPLVAAEAPRAPVEETDRDIEFRSLAAESSRKVVTLGRHTVALAPSTSAVVEKESQKVTLMKLQSGTVACQVSPLGDDEIFRVVTADLSVQVVGTRFSVSHHEENGTAVVVQEGQVDITSADNGRVSLRSGKKYDTSGAQPTEAADRELVAIDRLLAEDSTNPTGPAPADRSPRKNGARATKGAEDMTTSLQVARERIAGREFAEAEALLAGVVVQNPKNGAAWLLLGDCRRKIRRWDGAIDAYDHATQYLSASKGSRAIYESALIYQKQLNDHRQAVRFFERYLKRSHISGTMRDVAHVDLARSLISLGKTKSAKALLSGVIENQGQTHVAANAKRLLDQIDE